MKINTRTEDAIYIHSAGAGTLTRNTVRERAVEPDTYRKEAVLESAPESKRRGQQRGFTGHMVPVGSLDEEDGEGRCYSERLFEVGFKEAAHV